MSDTTLDPTSPSVFVVRTTAFSWSDLKVT
jgi:hypothetical protein